ncbi:unnamed protein product [Parajaminaea phylloscopi]
MNDFTPPLSSVDLPQWSIVIEFCDRCRWLHRAVWVQTELFLTFGPKPPSDSNHAQASGVRSVTLLPMTEDDTAGRFRVWIYGGESPVCAWDRKTQGGFPELKLLKQRIRDVISPSQSLGHSDAKEPEAKTPSSDHKPEPGSKQSSGCQDCDKGQS